jgi:hypothetical protein
MRKEQLERERACVERLNESHETTNIWPCRMRKEQLERERAFVERLNESHEKLNIWPCRMRKEQLEREHVDRERAFVERLNESHETAMKRLADSHRERIALLDRQFLQQKQQLMRAREVSNGGNRLVSVFPVL